MDDPPPLRFTEDPAPGDIIKTCSFRPTLCGAASAERELLADKSNKVNPPPDQSNVSYLTV